MGPFYQDSGTEVAIQCYSVPAIGFTDPRIFCSRQTLPETHSPTPRFQSCFHRLSMHSCSAFCMGQTSLWLCSPWEFYVIDPMGERAGMGRQQSQLTGEVHVSLRPLAAAPESSSQRSCPGCQASERCTSAWPTVASCSISTSIVNELGIPSMLRARLCALSSFRSELHRLYDSTSVGSAGLALR